MKVVLSRKGCDSAAGKLANPIFPDGTLAMLPIPEGRAASQARTYGDIYAGHYPLGVVVEDLSRGRIGAGAPAHLDPDIDPGSVPRLPGWKPIFGQSGIAERHLQRMGVGAGDLFLFWGWFRHVERRGDRWRYVVGSSGFHALFGWLLVEQRIDVRDRAALPAWAADHPHIVRSPATQLDSVYIATERLNLPGISLDVPGAGVFPRLNPALCLTAPGRTRSYWRLPRWFFPGSDRPPLTYHADERRWTPGDDAVVLRSAAQGQEFVLNLDSYPEAIMWLRDLFVRCR